MKEKTYTLSGNTWKLPENVTSARIRWKAEIKVEVTKKEVTPPVEKEEYDYSQCKRFEDGNCEA